MNRKSFCIVLSLSLLVSGAVAASIAIASDNGLVPARPEGPCDVYAAGGTPCTAAHSTTRALFKNYNGPLYQIMRQSDGKTLDIGVVQPSEGDAGGYADAAAQDQFCENTYCWITILYDQSGKGNDLTQAPRGGFSGPAMGGFNNVPLADWAPVTVMGHKVYGLMIAPGMGMRRNDTHGTAVDDQAEGQYWVISGHHYNTGCCFDYGNAETDSRDDGDGTMETTYFGNQPSWYHGQTPGPWVMTDQENNLVGCVNPDPDDKYCANVPSISWRFVTAMADGEPHHWRSMGGNAQGGDLQVMYDGGRIINDRSSYDPMRKQGAILLGNGGDNSNGSSGTFYEAAMTAGGTFPTIETNQKLQANVVAAGYDVASLSISGAGNTDEPGGLQTFSTKTTNHTAVTFVNTSGKPINDLSISLVTPGGWKSVVSGTKDKVRKIGYQVAPGQTVIVNFTVTSGRKAFNGDLKAKAEWTGAKGTSSWTAVEKVRNVAPVKINEFRIADGEGNSTNSFIELYNAGESAVNISGWTLTEHAINIPSFSSIKIPAGTRLEAKGFYVIGLSNSGLSVQAAKGDNTIYVRDVKDIKAGDEIQIGSGKDAETVKVASVKKPAPQAPAAGRMGMPPMGPMGASGTPTTIWQPLPEGPVVTIPAGSKNIPVTSTNGFNVGDKMAIGYGATYPAVSNTTEKYEVVTITGVGKQGTQAWLSVDAKKGDTNIKVSDVQNISAGDKIRLDIDSKGHGVETVTVKSVGTQSQRGPGRGPFAPGEDIGTGLELTAPLQFNHSANIPFSVRGTGITFEPATAYDHSSNEPVLDLSSSIELQQPLKKAHGINDVVFDAKVKTAGYQNDVPADLLFGGPELATTSGNMTLRTANGLIVDALNYGAVVDPWLGEGYQGKAGSAGNFAQAPAARRGWGWFMRSAAPTATPEISSGRFPDGADTDNNESDFHVQNSMNISAPANAGENNIKVSSVQGLTPGQFIYVGAGASRERMKVANIGTSGAAALTSDAAAGSRKLSVASSQAFKEGQTLLINGESVTVASIEVAPRRMGPGMDMSKMPSDALILSAPLKSSAHTGDFVTGTGVTFSKPLAHAHGNGEAVSSAASTPGMPNRY